MRYLLFGATGHLGMHVVNQLVKEGREVRIFVPEENRDLGKLWRNVEVFAGEPKNAECLEAFFAREAGDELTVVNCTSLFTLNRKFSMHVYDTNVGNLGPILEQCRAAGVERYVHTSYVAAMSKQKRGIPRMEPERYDVKAVVSFCAQTLARGAQDVMNAAEKDGLNASILLTGGLCGPGDYAFSLVTQLILDAAKGRLPVSVRGDFVLTDVRDAAAGVVACCEKGRRGESYLLADRTAAVPALVQWACGAAGTRAPKRTVSPGLARAGIPFYRMRDRTKGRAPMITKAALAILKENSAYSCEKAKAELGYVSRSPEETVKDTVAWLKAEAYI